MQPIVVGTAGHIDHGKTSLVQRLTGVNTDRLKEEQKRGITIELGFTNLVLSSGRRLGFVDVPGHEKLVRTMVAGASGVDLVLLVIAADEGVMPQTREHLNVLKLLGVELGLVVLTKIDLVDDELLELAQMDVEDFLQGSFLEDAPIVNFSSHTGDGEKALLEALEALIEKVESGPSGEKARLSVDRVFSQKGFGTIVTGTLSSGEISVGDSLSLLPGMQKVKVRGLQTFGDSVQTARPGGRTAVNLQGIDWNQVSRGDVLATTGSVPVTSMLDVYMELLPDAAQPFGGRIDTVTGLCVPSKHAPKARLLSGTLEVLGRFILMDCDFLLPGQGGYVQIRLERPIPIQAGERFIVRRESPMMTLAGGVVLQAPAPRHRRRDFEHTLDMLSQLHTGSLMEVAGARLQLAALHGSTAAHLAPMLKKPIKDVEVLLTQAPWAVEVGNLFFHVGVLIQQEQRIVARLEQHHMERPLSMGLPKGALKPGDFMSDRVLHVLLSRLQSAGELVAIGSFFQLSRFELRLNAQEEALKAYTLDALKKADLQPLPIVSLLEKAPTAGVRSAEDLIGQLIVGGQLIRVREGHYWHKLSIQSLKEKVSDWLQAEGEMSPSDFKELTGLTRKYAIPLLEFLDKSQFTVRVGDKRRLRS